MIENPHEWVKDFAEYIEKPLEFQYGMLCIISKNAPIKSKKAYEKYISLVKKTIQSYDAVIIENWEIKGFHDVADDAVYKEQIEIAKELIKKGIISSYIEH